MISITKIKLSKKEIASVVSVLKSGMLATGPKTVDLEKRFADLCGTKYAVAVNTGTAALHTALVAAGIKPGDEVITVAFTFVATANAILMAGAKPVFVDIDEKTYNIDSSKIEKAITKKTKAIMPVNLYGQAADYNEINRIAKKHNLIVIEDAAQSVNAKYGRKISGNLADIACFSLYATKNIMCGEGGVITTNNKDWYERCMEFRSHGQPIGIRYVYKDFGYNYRLSDVLAAIVVEQIKRIDVITKARQLHAKQYNNAFNSVAGLIIPEPVQGRTHVYHQYTLRVTNDFPLSRDEFKSYLEKKGIYSIVYYPTPIHTFPHLKRYADGVKLPVSDRVAATVLSIPVHPLLKKSELKHIINTIKNI